MDVLNIHLKKVYLLNQQSSFSLINLIIMVMPNYRIYNTVWNYFKLNETSQFLFAFNIAL